MKAPDLLHEWIGKCVLTRDVPVEIIRLRFREGEEPHAEGVDERGRHYLFPVSELSLLKRPIEGVVKRGKRLP